MNLYDDVLAFSFARTRESIHSRVVLDIGDDITSPIYDEVIDASEWDHTADRVSLAVKDNIWANIPGEGSA